LHADVSAYLDDPASNATTAKPTVDADHGADSDEAGHAFQSEAGHLFQREAGRASDLKPATEACFVGSLLMMS
jgi:hypothetical protein